MSDITLTPGEVPAVLKQIRMKQGMTLRELGHQVYESNVVLSYRERGKRPVTLDNVARWAGGLGYRVEIVLKREKGEECP